MECPKCKGRTIVMDIVHNKSKKETYRKKRNVSTVVMSSILRNLKSNMIEIL